jgi:hypothetical protein
MLFACSVTLIFGLGGGGGGGPCRTGAAVDGVSLARGGGGGACLTSACVAGATLLVPNTLNGVGAFGWVDSKIVVMGGGGALGCVVFHAS